MVMIRDEYAYDTYGLTEVIQRVSVNLELLWNNTKDEELFISYYSKVVLHEHLHYLIQETYTELYEDKEEEIVDKISESYTMRLPKQYYQVLIKEDFYK